NAYRFSVEWSKIEPERGAVDVKERARYVGFVKKLRAHGIEPFVTLWHWPVPLWVRDQGGWEPERTVEDFGAFAARMADAFGDDVTYYVTLNEPQVYTSNSYVTGEWPPQKTSKLGALRVFGRLIRAHE